MAGKNTKTAVHTSGIYADMTVDGPEIGTLIVIVDRAKNLPNRKSMGKQNPYCAARLGKEAKKTETDKRGGQTPRWDQEIRFTVHDSPDYYQLKVSVFNDDKKTELIGETWVALDQIVVPGGGQNDVWHTLNCKGKFAGEIRIELTYYDTRPREEKPEKRRQSAPIDSPVSHATNTVAGPREPRPVKRRPLPADPTDAAQPSPQPYTPPANNQQHYANSAENLDFENASALERLRERPRNSEAQATLSGDHQQQHFPQSGGMSMTKSSQQFVPGYDDTVNMLDPMDQRQHEHDLPEHAESNGYLYDEPVNYTPDYQDQWQSRPLAQPLQNTQGMIHAHSSPAMIDARPRQGAPFSQHYTDSSLPSSYRYDENPMHGQTMRESFALPSNNFAASAREQEAPPPPPVHRNSGSRSSSHVQGLGQEHGHAEQYPSIPTTAPLNVRNGRGSITGSPLSQVQSTSAFSASISPSNSQSISYPAQSISSHTSYTQLREQHPRSPIRDYAQSVPPSLVPGYEPSIAEDESERIMHEKRMSARHYSSPPRSQYQQMPTAINPEPQNYQQPGLPIDQLQLRAQQESISTPTSTMQARPRHTINVQDKRAHRQSAPIVHPNTVNPNLRTPVRKSVSPHPESAPVERRHSGIPFSPDSFDTFNPLLSKAISVNEPGATYNTPEQAKEASRQHERQEKLGDGPIIGNDGRIIDPSDHLPSDTWAPEPEQKTPKKGPQVTMRFRHSPQGAQPMPAQRRPVVEHSMSSPAYVPSPDNDSPSVGTRTRLQKKACATMGQPASSPIVPTLKNAPRNSPLRLMEPNYPLRERENAGGYGSSPTYGRPSYSNIPPPIPGKIPIGGGQEDWDSSALSEEMRRIDIGVGGGQGRARRSRYGM